MEEINRMIAKRLSVIRLKAGLSLTQLANLLKIPYQTIQKYENGERKITAAMMSEFSRALNVPIETFYPSEETEGVRFDLMSQRELKILRLLSSLAQQEQNRFLEILREIDNLKESNPPGIGKIISSGKK